MPSIVRNGVSLHYEVRGAGVPVLFHTGGGGDAQMWVEAGYLDHFGDCRVLLYDHRGHGKSDQPLAAAAHAPSEYVEDVESLLDGAGVDAAILVGYSGGAATLLRFAAEHPDRVHALVALGSVPEPPSPGDWRSLMAADVRRRGTRALMEEFSSSEREPAPTWLIDNLATTTPEMFALPLEAAVGTTPLWDLADKVASPTLLLCGEDEVERSALDGAVARMPNAEAVSLPRYGHLQAFWHGEVTAPIMVRWLHQIGALS